MTGFFWLRKIKIISYEIKKNLTKLSLFTSSVEITDKKIKLIFKPLVVEQRVMLFSMPACFIQTGQCNFVDKLVG